MEGTLRLILLIVGLAIIGFILWDGLRRVRSQPRPEHREDEASPAPAEPASRDGQADWQHLETELAELKDLIIEEEHHRLGTEEVDSVVLEASKRTEAMPRESGRRSAQRPQNTANSKVPSVPDLILVLHVTAGEEAPFRGPELVEALQACGLRFGEMRVFHYLAEGTGVGAAPVFSVANMLEPGTLDPKQMGEDFVTHGVTLFMRLPGPMEGLQAFDVMLEKAVRIAGRLEGELWDEQRSVLTRQTIEHYRERIMEFNRKRLTLPRRGYSERTQH
jgi:cell division protein ZipA